MIVANRMTPNPTTVSPEAPVDQALERMRQKNVRHLPVVDADGHLVGLVTDHALNIAWFPSLLEELTVADVMDADPLWVSPQTSVYEAARLVHRNRITGLPVLDGDDLIGIITLGDMLAALIEVLGLLTESVRLDVELTGGSQALRGAMDILRDNDAEPISVALLPAKDERKVYCFRLKPCDRAAIEAQLTAAGHRVLA